MSAEVSEAEIISQVVVNLSRLSQRTAVFLGLLKDSFNDQSEMVMVMFFFSV